MNKVFSENQNVGKAKYVVNHHDGVKTHKDGSLFFDIAIFSNQQKKNQFVKGLRQQGYLPVSTVLDDTLGELAHLDMYFVQCREIGQGINTKETVKYRALADRVLALGGDFESEYHGEKISERWAKVTGNKR